MNKVFIHLFFNGVEREYVINSCLNLEIVCNRVYKGLVRHGLDDDNINWYKSTLKASYESTTNLITVEKKSVAKVVKDFKLIGGCF